MKIYHYDFETGIYLGEGVADPSPLEEGVWLTPAQATELAPPEIPAGKYAAFKNNNWNLYDILQAESEPEPSFDPPNKLEVK